MATRRIDQRQMLFALIFFFSYHANFVTGTKYVTCSSVMKLMNVDYNVRLHSHDIKYGSGSGQQSVTGTEAKEDGNSYWLLKGKSGQQCQRGKLVKCGDVVRLEHIGTKKNLHSHRVSSPLSGRQEVSAYGDSKGQGDTGDDWRVLCHTEFWERNESVQLNHVDTDQYLSVSGRAYGSPIAGQIEVVADSSGVNSAKQWKATEGFFIHPSDLKTQHYEHTEL